MAQGIDEGGKLEKKGKDWSRKQVLKRQAKMVIYESDQRQVLFETHKLFIMDCLCDLVKKFTWFRSGKPYPLFVGDHDLISMSDGRMLEHRTIRARDSVGEIPVDYCLRLSFQRKEGETVDNPFDRAHRIALVVDDFTGGFKSRVLVEVAFYSNEEEFEEYQVLRRLFEKNWKNAKPCEDCRITSRGESVWDLMEGYVEAGRLSAEVLDRL